MWGSHKHLTIQSPWTAAQNRSQKLCLQAKGIFRLAELVTEKAGTSKVHSYKWQEGILFCFILKTNKKRAGIPSPPEDGNCSSNSLEISAVSTAFSSTCCSIREAPRQGLPVNQRDKQETISRVLSSKHLEGLRQAWLYRNLCSWHSAVRALPEAKGKLTHLQVTKQRLDPLQPDWCLGNWSVTEASMEWIHSADNVKKVTGIKVPEDSGLEEKSFPCQDMGCTRESGSASPQIRSTGNTITKTNTQGAEGQSTQENSKSLYTVLTQLNCPVP